MAAGEEAFFADIDPTGAGALDIGALDIEAPPADQVTSTDDSFRRLRFHRLIPEEAGRDRRGFVTV